MKASNLEGVYKMFKKWNIIIATTLLTLIGGASVVDASASMPTESNNRTETSVAQNDENFLDCLFQNWKDNWQVEEDVSTSPVEQEEVTEQEAPKEEVVEQEKVDTKDIHAFEQKVSELTNEERVKNGLTPLQLDLPLSKVAREKSNDMLNKNYFDHQSPTYGSPFDMMKQFGITYQSAGENIAMGQASPEEVVQAWMNSPGHRANILNDSFTHIGVGYVEDGNYWTQLFIGK